MSRSFLACLLSIVATAVSAAEFDERVKPLLAKHCVRCHGPQKQLADVRLDTLDPDVVNGNGTETWHDVLGKLNKGEMPPEDEPQPTDAERAVLVDWLTAEFARLAAEKRSTGGQVVLRRLTRYEYRNTMRDLLGIDVDFARDLPPESISPDGFQNNGSTLGLSPLQIELYLKAAREGLGRAIVEGERPKLIEARAEASESTRRKKSKVSNRLEHDTRFLLKLDEFPREGTFRVRVKARSEVPDGTPTPRLNVSVGVRADVQAPKRTLAEIEVPASDESQVFEFVGRMEEFPQPGHNPKFPGLLVTLESPNAPKPAKPKKGKKDEPRETEPPPALPVIVVESVEFTGPLFDAWPPTSHTRILFDDPTRASDETAYARRVITRFAERAFRRPVRDGEIDEYVGFFEEVRPDMPSLEQAVRETLAMVLVSPDFLYLVEPTAEDEEDRELDDFELASRLSYFLWSTMPDDELLELARDGRLQDAASFEKKVRSMLADPRADEFVARFTEQWLDLSGVDRVAVNPEYFPNFDDTLKADMQEETRLFFREVLRQNLPATTLVDADFAIVNRRLAEHYGLPAPAGSGFERVALDADDRRGGLLTQASVLLANSNGEQSHPIKRAVWLRTRLLDDPPAPPPPDVPELDEDDPKLAKLSLKEQLEQHRTKPACNSCHRGIDPWGVAFENFDAVGRWRTEYEHRPRGRKGPVEKSPVDVAAELPGGHAVDGMAGLKQHLLTTDRPRFARAVARKMLAYAVGRSLERTDEPAVDALVAEFEKNDLRLGELVVAITRSEPFRTK